VQPETAKSAVYFDGSCPLCQAEIAHYRGTDRAAALCFVDVSATDASLPAGLTRQQAMDRFHVRDRNGQLLSGAAAFVEVWSRLPRWRWAARATALPGAMRVLEGGYRVFLPIRPLISRLFGKLQSRLGRTDQAPRQ
jgi:predicted DCC family thiol-disulfide oxidoreductase YuxK